MTACKRRSRGGLLPRRQMWRARRAARSGSGWGGGTESVELAGDEGEARNGCAARGESANSDVVR